jgi:hypothetical protein
VLGQLQIPHQKNEIRLYLILYAKITWAHRTKVKLQNSEKYAGMNFGLENILSGMTAKSTSNKRKINWTSTKFKLLVFLRMPSGKRRAGCSGSHL